MKKIPYGIINFEELITEEYEYVDKTMYLEKLENNKKTVSYLRPSRFGKSLFTSMMFYYYDIKSADKFDALFKDTYIGKNPTENKNSYYVLKFDFSGISTGTNINQEDISISFKKCVVSGIKAFNDYYGINYTINVMDKPDDILKDFLTFLNGFILNQPKELQRKLYIIIDEYDNFTNAILDGDAKQFLDIVGNTGFVKSFYANIKIFVKEGLIDRFFATGICPITLNSMTTGFNIATDLSTDREFDQMIGLTHEEVKYLIDSCKDKEELYKVMIENYDGYLFSDKLEDKDRTFNATLVMYLLDYYKRFEELPDNYYDNNITVNYGKIDSLLKLQGNNIYHEIIDEILKNNEIEGTLITQFNLLEDITRDGIISLLYYFGYLTIKEKKVITNKIVFKIPNRAMIETYNNYFIKLLRDQNIILNSSLEEEYLEEILYNGKIDKISNYVSELIEMMSNKNYIGFNEKNVKLLYLTLLLRNRHFNIYDEFQCGDGFADLLILKNSELAKYDILIELKYIKKEDYTEDLLENHKNDALKQLKYYSSDARIPAGTKKYVVIFVGSELKVLEEAN